ncbi:MAG: fatty acid desaturase [Thermosynechococcaceae cyanobacterium]
MQTLNSQSKIVREDTVSGLIVAIAIFSLWVASLLILLPLQRSTIPLIELLIFILGRTFLHTGLFIVAHDAMHSNLAPHNQKINDWVGFIAVKLYAFLPYRQCRTNHKKHHKHTGQVGDPDFHDGIHSDPFSWYLKFVGEYLQIRSMIIFLIAWCFVFLSVNQIFQISFANFILFWVVPLILSSIQLFFFGTYLPHRENFNRLNPILIRTQSRSFSILISLVTCYHFGHYHREHHDYPQIPWYLLPQAKGS